MTEVTRGRLFDAVAELYDEVRPEYPEGFYCAIESMTGPLSSLRVLDLAAGSGIATRALLTRGADVVPVDPGVPLLQQLRRRTPAARCVGGQAEALPLRAGSVDLVSCATAWHWVDADRALAEVRRVLRPGGHLALWWANHRRDDTIAWEAAQGAVQDRWAMRVGSRPPTTIGVGPRTAARHLRRSRLRVVVDTEFRWSRIVPTDVHLRVLATHSDVLALGEDRQALLAEIAAALRPWDVVEERLWGPLVVARMP